jgi:aminoglycoside phosphotransferase (APT) family kinase protein
MALNDELDWIAGALGQAVLDTRPLAGGFSHETCLLTLKEGQVVARFGGCAPAVEAAVMARARQFVPVPEVLCVLSSPGDGMRPVMLLEYVAGTSLSEVLDGAGGAGGAGMEALGAEVGAVIARISAAAFAEPGFFAGPDLSVDEMPPDIRNLPEMAASCMEAVPAGRLDPLERRAWVEVCAAHAPALSAVDGHARLVHSDANPKNILVTPLERGWRVDAVLDWEFSFSGSPYADAANMLRFGNDYPTPFADGFRTEFGSNLPADLPPDADWAYLGRVLDMYALSDLVTRPEGHPLADRAAREIRSWIADGIPR